LRAFSGVSQWTSSKDGFGFAPDHDDGSLEAIILIALVTIISGLGLGFFRKHHVRK
jgi:hypothetical protein